MSKMVIGLVGEQGAGKEEMWKAICKVSRENEIYSYARYSTSVFLRKMLDNLDIIDNRDNITKLVGFLEATGGEGDAMRRMLKSVRTEKPALRVIDSIRMLPDETALRAETNNILLYVTADPKIRFNRVRKRGEKPGEKDLTWEKFLEQGISLTEKHVPEIGSRADWKIENEGTLEELEEKVRQGFAKTVKSALKRKE
ncbi:MAG: hypothetical protein AAB389_02560 [Patescibacteria group bacterium]